MVLKLIDKQLVTDNIWTFRFQPDGELKWHAGQYVRVELPHDNPDDEGTKRWFTNAAAPYEGILQITTRITGTTFKTTLSALEVGDDHLQLIEEPDGDFTWHESDIPKVFVAAGIGVTTYHSILKQRDHDGQQLNVTLIYGGRTDALPFKDELQQWQTTHPELTVLYVIGEHIDAPKLRQLVPNLDSCLVYVSGPEPMVQAINADLTTNGFPGEQIKTDEFPNYNETNY